MTGRYNSGNKTDTRQRQLQKVKRNRAALDVKRGFKFRYKKAFVNQ